MVKDREALQEIAQFLLSRDDTHFVTLLARNTAEARRTTGIIIPDLRRRVEFDWCVDNGFLVVKLVVSEATQLARGAEPGRLAHHTETALDTIPDSGWDLVLPENTRVEERVEAVARLVAKQGMSPTAGGPRQFGKEQGFGY